MDRIKLQLSTFFRALAFLVAVCCLSWVGVLWWWQRSGHSIELHDVVIYLGLLPLALALLLLALRWVWQRAAARAAAAAAAASAGAAAPAAADSVISGDEQARHMAVQLVHAASCSVVGDQISDLLDAAADGKPVPQPDAQLLNGDDLPVLCARIPNQTLALEVLRAELSALLPKVHQQQAQWQDLQPGEHVLRALAALKEPLLSQQECLLKLDQAHKAALGERGSSATRWPQESQPALPAVRVLLGWPLAWSGFEQAVARTWVEALLCGPESGLHGAYALSFATLSGAGEELWLRADQMSQPAHRTPFLLVAACHSDLSQERVDALLATQSLYDAAERPSACVPGEAAAALLLAPPDWLPPAEMSVNAVWLHRPALTRRAKPVEAAGRIDHQELAQAMSQALMAAQIDAPAVAALVCDADQHSPRNAELFGVAVEALAHLDPVQDVRLLGKISGHTGVASWLLVLTAAAASTLAQKKITLALGLADSQLRMALVLKPKEESDAA